ncbi:MAG: 16S rRNA (uracil(1498)-N(3))-methyltransferase [candidate division Zixibacteria bacterium]|nr:16S rRNA (uracil(1498)-N(3))-methyltransferase [candidate division Zixibacteria bacterium]
MEIKATNFIVSPNAVNDNMLSLDETESHHLAKVFRAQKGDLFYAIDGQGRKYQAVINSITISKVTAEIIKTTRLENEPLLKLSLAMGLCRPAKIDFIVEKGTEIGVSHFHFFSSEKTLADDYIDRSANKKIARWKKIATAAAKQSLRTIVPQIHPPVAFADILRLPIDYHLSLIADMTHQPSSLDNLFTDQPREALILVGPEAGLSAKEIDKALDVGFKPIKLGPRRLRAETAAILFASLVMEKAGEI